MGDPARLDVSARKVPLFVGKVIQMFDVFNIRFGATLVGPTGAGKTTCYRMLAAVMSDLRSKGSANPDFQVRAGARRGTPNQPQRACSNGFLGDQPEGRPRTSSSGSPAVESAHAVPVTYR